MTEQKSRGFGLKGWKIITDYQTHAGRLWFSRARLFYFQSWTGVWLQKTKKTQDSISCLLKRLIDMLICSSDEDLVQLRGRVEAKVKLTHWCRRAASSCWWSRGDSSVGGLNRGRGGLSFLLQDFSQVIFSEVRLAASPLSKPTCSLILSEFGKHNLLFPRLPGMLTLTVYYMQRSGGKLHKDCLCSHVDHLICGRILWQQLIYCKYSW